MRDDPNHTRWDEIIPPHPDAKRCPECGLPLKPRVVKCERLDPAPDWLECPVHGEFAPDEAVRG